MKRLLQVIGLLIGLLVLCAAPSAAQESLSITPTQLVVTATQGQVVNRTLLVRSDVPLSAVRIVPMDLKNAEGEAQFAAQAVRVSLESTDLAAQELLSVQLQFDLAQVPPGEYAGDLLVSYAGGSRAVPVQIAVKSTPWLPVAALVTGVALGVGVSGYRAKGRPRDEVMVRIGQIRTQMKVDEELHQIALPFLRSIEAQLVDVEVALEGQQWEQARRAAQKANDVWVLWRRGRPDWIVQFEAYERFIQRLRSLGEEIHFIAELLQAAVDVHRNVASLDEPQSLKAQLEPLMAKANAFLTLQARIASLGTMGPRGSSQAEAYREQLFHLSPHGEEGSQQIETLGRQVEETLTKLRKADLAALLASLLSAYREQHPGGELEDLSAFQDRIDELTPQGDGTYLDLRNDLIAEIQALTAAAAGRTSLEYAGEVPYDLGEAVAKGALEVISPVLLGSLPTVRVQTLEGEVIAAARRLKWFTWLTYSVAVVLLALAGYVELYSTRPDFGAKGAADYFALLAWGFGAEATRSAISDMVQSWGLVRQ